MSNSTYFSKRWTADLIDDVEKQMVEQKITCPMCEEFMVLADGNSITIEIDQSNVLPVQLILDCACKQCSLSKATITMLLLREE